MSIDSYSTFTAVRASHPAPPALTFAGGRFCPVDLCHAPLRRDSAGWSCTGCPARWDVRGSHASWDEDGVLALAHAGGEVAGPVVRSSVVPLIVGVAGCAAIAAVLADVVEGLDQRLVWWLAGAIAAAAVVYVAVGWLSHVIVAWPYRHNRVISQDRGVSE